MVQSISPASLGKAPPFLSASPRPHLQVDFVSMRLPLIVTIALLTLLISACGLKVKQQAKTPPVPQPTMAKAEPPPVPVSTEPLSIPQTQVRLPQPQPVDPQAVVLPPPPAEPVVSHQKKSRPPRAPAQPKPEPAETADTPPPAEAQPHRLEPVMPEDQRRQQIEEISARLSKADAALNQILTQPLTDQKKRDAAKIRNLANQAYKAKDEGDIQKANGLADRIQLMIQDLSRGR